VILSGGVIVADSDTIDILQNEQLMSEQRLELPFGFDPNIALKQLK
jgi:cobalt/nickel transport system ATP-binding protein